jgi:lipopolysaccharide transport system permease protein
MTPPSTSLRAFFRSLHAHRELCWRLGVRELTQRFKGSMLGILWAVLTPLLTAAVFTLVFTGVFPSRWPGRSGDPADFALMLLVGLAVHGLMSEALSRAPGLVVGNASYVTKVVFPLEVLPVVTTLTAAFNLLVTLGLVLVGQLLLHGTLYWTTLFLPLVLLPYLILVTAAVAMVAACGVFLRDVAQVVGPAVMLMMFLGPIFYPLEAVPARMRPIVQMNPVTLIIEQSRAVTLYGHLPDFLGLAIYAAVALGLLAVAHWAFQRLRVGFADVL